jgi:hypothetical protein
MWILMTNEGTEFASPELALDKNDRENWFAKGVTFSCCVGK